MADEDEAKEYRWETGYERTWLVFLFNHLLLLLLFSIERNTYNIQF